MPMEDQSTVPGLAAEEGADAPRDALTGLPGMEAARQRLAGWLAEGAVGPQGAEAGYVHALLLGVRRFDTINIAYGEAAGDGVLLALAERITRYAASELGGAVMVARGPGGTFLILANEACSRERWQMFAEQLADLVALPIVRRSGTVRLSPRLALLRVVGQEAPLSVFDRLAQTLEQAKRNLGRRVVWADGETTRVGRTAAQLEADLLRAIDRREIEVVFQPQFALVGGADSAADPVVGAEALARWNHPKLGRIGAGALFAAAERADHVAPLSRHIAQGALAAARGWPGHLRLSLNVTASDLAAASYAGEMAGLVAQSGFPAGRLTLEVTEQVLLADMQLAERSLAALAGAGMRIALDDFGAGFCNFRYLKTLPLHYLKLDRSMVDGISEDARDLAVLRAIVAMARALDLAVIAEGIETEAQRLAVAREGCAIYQGFLRARPMRAAAFAALVGRGQ
ncbi:MAG TPA: bifunctional diguanylate cyclase/phosphodiesterase [Novosphingobium sp.]|nr:bifunctional diguanylate cyclase/phosphodiesterase [Novosphingobium sp.]HZV08150.1 bifunctional diguanylate cyclase/phosphodiesterase [Novosphingobium sp.]